MLACHGLQSGEVRVVRGSLDDAAFADPTSLDEIEQQRARDFAVDLHRHRFVAGRAFLRAVLGRHLGRDPRALRFRYGAFGKPALADDEPLHFNVAHAGDRVVVALAADREVGIDLELQRRIGPRVARALLSPRERARLAGLGDDARQRALRLLVVAKEALVKAVGASVFRARDFDVAIEAGRPRVVGDDAWQLATLEDDADATLVVAARGARLVTEIAA